MPRSTGPGLLFFFCKEKKTWYVVNFVALWGIFAEHLKECNVSFFEDFRKFNQPVFQPDSVCLQMTMIVSLLLFKT